LRVLISPVASFPIELALGPARLDEVSGRDPALRSARDHVLQSTVAHGNHQRLEPPLSPPDDDVADTPPCRPDLELAPQRPTLR
jgi:hypothetical protein